MYGGFACYLFGATWLAISSILALTTIDDLGISWWCAHADRMEEDVDQFDDVECSEEPVAAPGGAELPFEQSIGRNMMVLRSLE